MRAGGHVVSFLGGWYLRGRGGEDGKPGLIVNFEQVEAGKVEAHFFGLGRREL